MLTEMLNQSDVLKNKTLPEQQIYMKLANRFQSNTQNLFFDPEELMEHNEVGTVAQWKELLQLQETQNFIKGQIAFFAQISQRKTFHSLVSMALSGNQQAAKQVQELSGIMNQQDQNRTVVLHQIPRPKREEINNG